MMFCNKRKNVCVVCGGVCPTLLTNYFQFLWKVKECVVVVQEKLSKKSNDFVGSFGGAESIYLLIPREMSRFWAGASSSESENESESDSDEEVQNHKNTGAKFAVIDSDSGMQIKPFTIYLN
jgi:hypothetical protein